MKLYDNVFTFDHLYKSYRKCIRGNRWKVQNQRFINNDIVNITKLFNELNTRTYKLKGTHEFDIIERGKPRHISAYRLKDRIVQRCLCDYCLTPLLSKSLIFDCGATLKKKGIYFQKRRTAIHLNKYFEEHKNNGYVLTIDIHHYFESINHEILLSFIKPYVNDPELYKVVEMCIYDNKKGLGLGSQVSQICALFYLNKIDHFIKEKLHIKYYGRYMDDLYLIHEDKKYLYKCFTAISKKIKELGLYLNQNKSKVHSLSNGFVFLKVRWILLDNGKILKLLTTQTFQMMRRKILKGIDVDNILPSWTDYLSYFHCYNKLKAFKKRFSLI